MLHNKLPKKYFCPKAFNKIPMRYCSPDYVCLDSAALAGNLAGRIEGGI